MIKDLLKMLALGLTTALAATAICLTGNAVANDSVLPRNLEASARQQPAAPIVLAQLQSGGSIITLDAPRIADYWISATLQPGGVIVFDGYAPDEATRRALQQFQGADTSWLKLGSGAPERYRAAVDFGLSALARMSEGRFSLRQNIITVSGIARTGADYQALRNDFSAGAPQGLVLAQAEIVPPVAADFAWTATKSADGTIALAGSVPSADDEAALLARAGPNARSGMAYASGAPNGFSGGAQTGLALLQQLSEGRVSLSGSAWTLTGTAASAAGKAAIEAEFSAKQLAAAGWSMAIGEPPAAAPPAPYLWAAQKAPDGTITLTGAVPADALKRFLGVRAGDKVVDQLELNPAAPNGFIEDVVAAIDALSALSQGSATFDGSAWHIAGQKREINGDEVVAVALATATTPAERWNLALTEPEPVVESAPVEPVAAAPTTIDPAYTFSATRAGGQTVLGGQVPTDADLQALATQAGSSIDALSVAPGAPEGFLANAQLGLQQLARLSDGHLNYAANAWTLSGIAPDSVTGDAVKAAIAGASNAGEWALDITLPEPAALPPAVAAIAPAPTTTGIATCAATLADFSARNAILYQSGAAVIATESEPALDELTLDLATCPDAIVHIEGHTDADGDEASNLALSVARAEAVIDALVKRGVNPARLYAVGYGESSPIADNETPAGKRLNRRIVVTVLDERF